MNKKEYWKQRLLQLEESQNKKGLECYEEIETQYRRAQREIEGKLSVWYQRLASNNGISMQEARKMLSGRELEEFKWDVEEYIHYGKKNAVNGMWERQLENASARYHISYLEALKIQTQQSLEVMFGNQLDSIDMAMRDIYREGYYKMAYEIQKGVGVGWDFALLDERQISKVIRKPWALDGKNFSDRIWGNREKLVKELHAELSKNIILGSDPQKAIDTIAKKMDVSKNNAGRLIMTEKAFFSSASQRDIYKELGVDGFEVVATLDSVTSEICRDMDGRHFPESQWEIGVTAPPFHVNCRTTTIPYFEDDFGEPGERAARGENGKTYYVPANMTYKEWQETFINKEGKANAIQIPQIYDEKIRSANEEFGRILNNSESTPFSDKMILYNSTTEYQLNKELNAPFVYNQELDIIQYNSSAVNFDSYDMNFVQAHELSHRMDILEYHSWENEKFCKAIENTKEKVYNNVDRIEEWFSPGGKYEEDVALSDIFSALSGGKLNEILCAGHGIDYWKGEDRKVCLEIFANMSAIDVMDYSSKEEFIDILKEIYEAYKELIG